MPKVELNDTISVVIEHDEFNDVWDYWHLYLGGELIYGTNTPNETMARKWLQVACYPNEVSAIITTAKAKRGWEV